MANLKIHHDQLVSFLAAERRLSIRHVGELEAMRPELALGYGVTSLADKIYVVEYHEIMVYKNKYPYESLEPIVFDDEDWPFWIASCSVNKCLYIRFYKSRLVFKVEPEFDNRVSKWLDKALDSIITVTSKGDILALEHNRGNRLEMLIIFNPEGTVKRSISMKYRFNYINSIEEIMPDIVAVIYKKQLDHEPIFIGIMRLDEDGTILRDIKWKQDIFSLSPFRYGDLLIVTNDDRFHYFRTVQLQHWTLESKVARDLLTTDETIGLTSIHFAADRKQLYVLHNYKLDIYKLNYEDEDCDA